MNDAHIRPTPVRWTRRKEARPSEILDAATEVFGGKGYAAARMEDIARKAGVTKGTIYLYFHGKEDVFKSLVEASISRQIADVVSMARTYEGTTPDLLRTILTILGTFLSTSDRAVLPKIIMAEASNFPELARFYREAVIDKGLALFSTVIERGVVRGEFRPLPKEHVARLCVTPLLLIAIWRTTFAAFDARPYDFKTYIETHVDVLLRGLTADGGKS